MLYKFYYWLHKKMSKPEERGEYSSGYFQDMIRERAYEICNNPRVEKIVEIGCGEGLFLEKIAQKKNIDNIVGVDIWQEILGKAKKRLEKKGIENIELLKASGDRVPLEDNSFDIVVCINVIYNLPSKEKFVSTLKEMVRIVKPGGKIVFDIRNRLNPLLRLKYKLAKYYDDTAKTLPLMPYRLKDVAEYLKECGCEIEKNHYLGFPNNGISPIIIIEAKKR